MNDTDERFDVDLRAMKIEFTLPELERLADQWPDLPVSVELDVMHTDDDYGFDDALSELKDGTTLASSVIDESGPGGGWPVVRFTGWVSDVVDAARALR